MIKTAKIFVSLVLAACLSLPLCAIGVAMDKTEADKILEDEGLSHEVIDMIKEDHKPELAAKALEEGVSLEADMVVRYGKFKKTNRLSDISPETDVSESDMKITTVRVKTVSGGLTEKINCYVTCEYLSAPKFSGEDAIDFSWDGSSFRFEDQSLRNDHYSYNSGEKKWTKYATSSVLSGASIGGLKTHWHPEGISRVHISFGLVPKNGPTAESTTLAVNYVRGVNVIAVFFSGAFACLLLLAAIFAVEKFRGKRR